MDPLFQFSCKYPGCLQVTSKGCDILSKAISVAKNIKIKGTVLETELVVRGLSRTDFSKIKSFIFSCEGKTSKFKESLILDCFSGGIRFRTITGLLGSLKDEVVKKQVIGKVFSKYLNWNVDLMVKLEIPVEPEHFKQFKVDHVRMTKSMKMIVQCASVSSVVFHFDLKETWSGKSSAECEEQSLKGVEGEMSLECEMIFTKQVHELNNQICVLGSMFVMVRNILEFISRTKISSRPLSEFKLQK